MKRKKSSIKPKREKKRITPASITGFLIGLWLMGTGLYYVLVYGSTGAYFVIVLGVLFNAVIIWSYRS